MYYSNQYVHYKNAGIFIPSQFYKFYMNVPVAWTDNIRGWINEKKIVYSYVQTCTFKDFIITDKLIIIESCFTYLYILDVQLYLSMVFILL